MNVMPGASCNTGAVLQWSYQLEPVPGDSELKTWAVLGGWHSRRSRHIRIQWETHQLALS